MEQYLAIDIGGTSIKYGLVYADGTLQASNHVPTPATWDIFLERLDDIFTTVNATVVLDGLAVSAPGAVDSSTGIIHGVSAVPYIHHRPFLDALRERYALPVTVLNDANAAALAEGWTGAGAALERFATVVIGTGVGGSFVNKDEVMIGSHFHGGEFGYWILDPSLPQPDGAWSAIGSTSALVTRCRERLGRPLSGHDIFALQTESAIQEELERFYRWNAIGLYNIQFSFDPERILIGGGISRRPEVRDGIKRHLDALCDALGTLRIDVETCAHFNEANLIGAARFHMLNVKKGSAHL
ncbi:MULTISPECIES: ROK family protein [Exiguobacterium]|uniref:ROK family protein n=1 Tax=Exiguobacterium TaxID=33986 RepID=UPI001BE6E0FE|nr:ROK family protein [Exiguobacterium himgiriensis]MCT4783223.1 ROK family protein [Exiguobacterium himgiriensis]